VNGENLQRYYKDFMSDFSDWNQKSHAKEYLLFPENIGEHLSIDETSMSQGELYTIVTNKDAKGKQGSIVAIISGTKAAVVIEVLHKIPKEKRDAVTEITLDMANSMKLIAKKSFTKAIQVTDRFHVQKLVLEALQDVRIKYRWQAIDDENTAISKAKQESKTYNPILFSNGDSPKQLLARGRYILYKSQDKWTPNQKQRADILFEQYPDIQKAYKLSQALKLIFNLDIIKEVARVKLAKWYNDVEDSGFKAFNIVSNTIKLNYDTILNYFKNRSTNASAESFNAKIKAFRSQFRGVKNIEFFLYRLTKIYA
jgi:transposase